MIFWRIAVSLSANAGCDVSAAANANAAKTYFMIDPPGRIGLATAKLAVDQFGTLTLNISAG